LIQTDQRFFLFMMFYIYILYSAKSDRYYVGHTNDVHRRLVEHNETSEKSYTSKMRPWVLKGVFPAGNDRGIAIRIEHHIKSQKSRKYLEMILDCGSIEKIIRRIKDDG
jgi:putative endonuclease